LRRNSSKRVGHRHSSDPLDELDNGSRSAAVQPNPPVRLGHVVRKFSALEDLRRWAPAGPAEKPREPARDVRGRSARHVYTRTAPKVIRGPGGKPLQSGKAHSVFLNPDRLRFVAPIRTVICLKRKARREVLFAFKRTGKGARTPKRRNQWSDVEC